MPIKYLDWIERKMLQAAPGDYFVFGDNVMRQGLGGQAKEMRGEPNAIGIATKWAPNNQESSFFSDNLEHGLRIQQYRTIDRDFQKVREACYLGQIVYVPSAGLGTGLSQLPVRAPLLYGYLYRLFEEYSLWYGNVAVPWPDKPYYRKEP